MISSAISYYAALVILLFHFKKPNIILKFSLKNISKKDLADIFKAGAPTAVASASTMVRNMILNLIMVGVAGSTAVAALSVRNTLNTLFGSILLGVGMTATMIAGMVYGEEDRRSAGHLLGVAIRYALMIGISLALLNLIAAPGIVRLFASGKSGSAEMVQYATRAMRFYAFGLPLYGVNMVFVNYLQGIERLKLANFVSLIDNLIYVIAIALILSPSLRTTAIWISYPIGEALVILTVFVLAMREKKRAPKKIEDLLFLDDKFGVAAEDSYERSFTTVDALMRSTEELGDFIRVHNADSKKTMLIPLCVEEMAKNVIEHGFNKDQKPHSVDLRVLKKDDEWIIRLRDNCRAFDPEKWMEIHHPEDPASNIGIRMVYGMARDVQYVNAMQLNNLIIKV